MIDGIAAFISGKPVLLLI